MCEFCQAWCFLWGGSGGTVNSVDRSVNTNSVGRCVQCWCMSWSHRNCRNWRGKRRCTLLSLTVFRFWCFLNVFEKKKKKKTTSNRWKTHLACGFTLCFERWSERLRNDLWLHRTNHYGKQETVVWQIFFVTHLVSSCILSHPRGALHICGCRANFNYHSIARQIICARDVDWSADRLYCSEHLRLWNGCNTSTIWFRRKIVFKPNSTAIQTRERKMC